MKARAAVALLIALQLAAQQPGQRVSIVTEKREVLDGRFVKWSADGIDVMRGKATRSIALADIHKVQMQEKASRWKAAMWGALVGFAAVFPCGAAKAGYISDQNNPRFGTRMGIGAGVGIFGAGIGAGIGALVGGHKYVTVYDEHGRRR